MCGSVRAIDVQHGNPAKLQPHRSGGRATKASCCGTAEAAAPARAGAARVALRFRRRCGRRADQKDDPEDVPDADRGAELAPRKPGRAPQRNTPLSITAHAKDAADNWLLAAASGVVRTRTGEAYKPSAIRAYRQALNHRVLPTLGTETAQRDRSHDAAGLRRPALSARTISEQRSQHDPAACGRSTGAPTGATTSPSTPPSN